MPNEATLKSTLFAKLQGLCLSNYCTRVILRAREREREKQRAEFFFFFFDILFFELVGEQNNVEHNSVQGINYSNSSTRCATECLQRVLLYNVHAKRMETLHHKARRTCFIDRVEAFLDFFGCVVKNSDTQREKFVKLLQAKAI